MRLLKRSPRGKPEFHPFDDDNPPSRYAVLSHYWTPDEEVSYRELRAGTSAHKTGYQKIRWCLDEAARRNIEYVWVDTCCIDRSDSTEVSTAINSMFRWYARATECYVFLGDVPHSNDLYNSYWWTRGWTLQELVAPRVVRFYTWQGGYLGDKCGLEELIHRRSRIPVGLLRGGDVNGYTFDERMSWAAGRDTYYAEDKVYCLLGILGVCIPLRYSEGETRALQRMMEEVERRRQTTTTSPTVGLNQNFYISGNLTVNNPTTYQHTNAQDVTRYAAPFGPSSIAFEQSQPMSFAPGHSMPLTQNFYVDGNMTVNHPSAYHQQTPTSTYHHTNTEDITRYQAPMIFEQTAQSRVLAFTCGDEADAYEEGSFNENRPGRMRRAVRWERSSSVDSISSVESMSRRIVVRGHRKWY